MSGLRKGGRLWGRTSHLNPGGLHECLVNAGGMNETLRTCLGQEGTAKPVPRGPAIRIESSSGDRCPPD